MRKLLVLLVLVLSAVWMYISWYWYTCIIKWFCGSTTEIVSTTDDDIWFVQNDPPQDIRVETPQEEVVVQKEEPQELVQEKPVEQEPVKQEVETVLPVAKKECETLIVTPIRLGNTNDVWDVKDLEDFLNAFEGESLEVNWVYDQADFEAVKRFQVKYASEILTPWGIKNPTGYVFKTTTEKINEIYCSK